MNRWLNHHLQAIKLVVNRMRANALSSLMIFLVFSVALCLPTLFYIAVDNVMSLTDHLETETEVSVFLTLDATEQQRDAISAILAKEPSVKAAQFVSKAMAWQQLQDKMNADNTQQSQQAVAGLSQNPLPDAFFVQTHQIELEVREALKNQLLAHAGVAEVLVNAEWITRLNTLLALGKKIAGFIALLLASVLLVVVGNTIRMQIITQKDEIEVSKLMGATNQFIKVPFLYAGALYGFFGGLLALAFVYAMVFSLNQSIAEIAQLYQSDFKLRMQFNDVSIMVMGVAVAIGWLGAYVAVSRTITAFKIH